MNWNSVRYLHLINIFVFHIEFYFFDFCSQNKGVVWWNVCFTSLVQRRNYFLASLFPLVLKNKSRNYPPPFPPRDKLIFLNDLLIRFNFFNCPIEYLLGVYRSSENPDKSWFLEPTPDSPNEVTIFHKRRLKSLIFFTKEDEKVLTSEEEKNCSLPENISYPY